MRLVVNSLVVIMIGAILAGAILLGREGQTNSRALETARSELLRFQKQVAVHSQLGKSELSDRGYPAAVDPDWFNGDLPKNPLLPLEHPWLDVADKAQADRLHPVVWATDDPSVARFWYNPYRGIVRARVPFDASEAHALELYGEVNGVILTGPPR